MLHGCVALSINRPLTRGSSYSRKLEDRAEKNSSELHLWAQVKLLTIWSKSHPQGLVRQAGTELMKYFSSAATRSHRPCCRRRAVISTHFMLELLKNIATVCSEAQSAKEKTHFHKSIPGFWLFSKQSSNSLLVTGEILLKIPGFVDYLLRRLLKPYLQ